MAFQAAIFMDNSNRCINDVRAYCPTIELVQIPESMAGSPNVPINDLLMQQYIATAHLEHNSYLRFMNIVGINDHGYDPISGIREPHIEAFDRWEAATRELGPNRALILDWDRTITIIEGVVLPRVPNMAFSQILEYLGNPPGVLPVTAVDTLMFMCGGGERLNMLVRWLSRVAELGIHIMILTNSPAPVQSARMYYELISTLVQGYPNCSIMHSGQLSPYVGNKGAALRADRRFSELCGGGGGWGGGYRKRMSRRNRNNKKRKTRSVRK